MLMQLSISKSENGSNTYPQLPIPFIYELFPLFILVITVSHLSCWLGCARIKRWRAAQAFRYHIIRFARTKLASLQVVY